MKGFCPFAESPDTQVRLFADLLFRRTDAKFPAQVADVAAAHHPAARVQILLLDPFEKFKPEFHLLAGSGRSSIPGNGWRRRPVGAESLPAAALVDRRNQGNQTAEGVRNIAEKSS